jgi:hypothetical protein
MVLILGGQSVEILCGLDEALPSIMVILSCLGFFFPQVLI